MAFAPSSTIYLCAVRGLDNTYTHQIYFATPAEQQSYFAGKVTKTFSEYLTVRKNKDGACKSSVRVNANIDDLYGCNYMYYQNANHGTRYFYCFITNLVYINEGTTEIEFETDVCQTWRLSCSLLPSYIVRQHSETDNIGDNVIPENFTTNDYLSVQLDDPLSESLNSWGYLLASSTPINDDLSPRGKPHNGIYQGLYFYYFPKEDWKTLNNFLDVAEEESGESVVFIACVPEFTVSKMFDVVQAGIVEQTDFPAWEVITLDPDRPDDYSGFKNNKMYTYPYYKLSVTNHSGDVADYAIEDFDNILSPVVFQLYGDLSANPSLTLYPANYKGINANLDEGISINSFPQCAFNNDTFKMWLAKNQFTTAASIAGGAVSIAGGIAASATGVGAMAGMGMVGGGVMAIFNAINQTRNASMSPNSAHIGNVKANLLTAIGLNKFEFYIRHIRPDYAKAIDSYFTLYGYAMNKIGVPKINCRKAFTYVQTVDCNLEGYAPADDMRRLKQMFNDGVTFWKPDAPIGNYNLDNSPV